MHPDRGYRLVQKADAFQQLPGTLITWVPHTVHRYSQLFPGMGKPTSIAAPDFQLMGTIPQRFLLELQFPEAWGNHQCIPLPLLSFAWGNRLCIPLLLSVIRMGEPTVHPIAAFCHSHGETDSASHCCFCPSHGETDSASHCCFLSFAWGNRQCIPFLLSVIRVGKPSVHPIAAFCHSRGERNRQCKSKCAG